MSSRFNDIPNSQRNPQSSQHRSKPTTGSNGNRDYDTDRRRSESKFNTGKSSQYSYDKPTNNNHNPRSNNNQRPPPPTKTQSSDDFVELNNLPAHVKVNGTQEFQRPISSDSQYEYQEKRQLLHDQQRPDSQYSMNQYQHNPNYAQLNGALPSHVKSSATIPTNNNYAQLNSVLPSHVKPSYVPQSDPSHFATPSKGFNATAYHAPPGSQLGYQQEKKRPRSCFGLCMCSGKMCVILTTVITLLIGLIFFFLWMRRPGFAPTSDLKFKASPVSTTSDNVNTFQSEIQYQILITNPNFYPLTLTKMDAKVIDSATGTQIGQGTLKNVYVGPLNQAYATLSLNLDYKASSDQDKTWQDLMAACPNSPETVTRVPLTTRTQIEARFNLFAWANYIPKDSLQRNLLCP